jgi:hydroxymethylpyrimidine/phosphomethylpyrimidine kinase
VILEDMAVAAFKVGALGSIENISVIAEIVSDYPDVPLILDPFISALANQEDEDDRLIAIRELLIPQATVMVASAGELTRLAETWREPVTGDALMLDAMRIIEMGCEYLLVTNTQTDLQEVANSLFDESGLVRQMPGRACRARSSAPARPSRRPWRQCWPMAGSAAGSLRGAGIHPGRTGQCPAHRHGQTGAGPLFLGARI